MPYVIGVILILAGIVWGCSTCKAKSINKDRQQVIEILSDVESVVRTRTIAYVDPTQTDEGVEEIYQLADRYAVNRQQVLGILSKEISEVVEKLSREGFKTVERNESKISKVMKEHDFQMSEWSSDNKVAEVGKAANADVILSFVPRFKPNSDGSSNVTVDAEFMDINTMQVINFKYDGSSFSNWDFNLLKLNTDVPDGMWYCDGLMKSSIKYNKNNAQYITPFAGANSLAKTRDGEVSKYLVKPMQRIHISDSSGYIVYEDGSEEEVTVKFTAEKDRNISVSEVSYEDVLDKKTSMYTSSGSGVSTMKIGNIIIRDENGKQLLKGPVYRRGSAMGVFVGTSAKDGTGTAYFLMFGK